MTRKQDVLDKLGVFLDELTGSAPVPSAPATPPVKATTADDDTSDDADDDADPLDAVIDFIFDD